MYVCIYYLTRTCTTPYALAYAHTHSQQLSHAAMGSKVNRLFPVFSRLLRVCVTVSAWCTPPWVQRSTDSFLSLAACCVCVCVTVSAWCTCGRELMHLTTLLKHPCAQKVAFCRGVGFDKSRLLKNILNSVGAPVPLGCLPSPL